MNAPSTDPLSFLNHHSELAALIREFDWEKTALGPAGGWPAHVKTLTSLALNSDLAMVMLWGFSGVMIYNDAYAEFAGGRHPQLLGSDVLLGWPEVADFNRHVLDAVLNGSRTLAYRDQHLVLARRGVPEDVFLNLDYSPIMDEAGKPAGVLAIVRETTDRIHTEQRLRIAQQAGHVGTFEWYPESGSSTCLTNIAESGDWAETWPSPPTRLSVYCIPTTAPSRVHPNLIWPIRLNMPNIEGSIL
jgi:PAS domain S-box-containing protein